MIALSSTETSDFVADNFRFQDVTARIAPTDFGRLPAAALDRA